MLPINNKRGREGVISCYLRENWGLWVQVDENSKVLQYSIFVIGVCPYLFLIRYRVVIKIQSKNSEQINFQASTTQMIDLYVLFYYEQVQNIVQFYIKASTIEMSNLFAFILPFTTIKHKRLVHRIHTSKFIVRVLPHNVYTDISKYCVYNID